ncbi:hypothetical protein RISK_002043 [Rhodopirellula islandica]|uniref:Uncharacterized protein n=1 Tax=Rhodopirellula islandica TaxID=595434 RepID=A0A0J1BI32_RHOIS|nr:hypothetical protein RISK_002043 [Rhodopirellula islandica]
MADDVSPAPEEADPFGTEGSTGMADELMMKTDGLDGDGA